MKTIPTYMIGQAFYGLDAEVETISCVNKTSLYTDAGRCVALKNVERQYGRAIEGGVIWFELATRKAR
jgi:hypothetical protein